MIATFQAGQKTWTEAELEALPENGYVHELVGGELVMSPKNDFYHGHICSRLLAALVNFNRTHRLGAVLDSSTGFWMRNRNCRAPDISFITQARLISSQFKPSTRKFFPGAPDLAVEILSPGNTNSEMNERLDDFFSSGTQIAWLINPDAECVEVCHSAVRREFLSADARLDGERLMPGFQFPVADLFKEWDWE